MFSRTSASLISGLIVVMLLNRGDAGGQRIVQHLLHRHAIHQGVGKPRHKRVPRAGRVHHLRNGPQRAKQPLTLRVRIVAALFPAADRYALCAAVEQLFAGAFDLRFRLSR